MNLVVIIDVILQSFSTEELGKQTWNLVFQTSTKAVRCFQIQEELRAEHCLTNIFEFPKINFRATRSALVPFTWRNCSNQPTMSHKTWPHGEVSLVLFPLDFCFVIFYRRIKDESISKLSIYVWLLCRYESHYRLQSSRGGVLPNVSYIGMCRHIG